MSTTTGMPSGSPDSANEIVRPDVGHRKSWLNSGEVRYAWNCSLVVLQGISDERGDGQRVGGYESCTVSFGDSEGFFHVVTRYVIDILRELSWPLPLPCGSFG